MGQYFQEAQLFSPQTHPARQSGFQRPDQMPGNSSGTEPSQRRIIAPRREPLRSALFGMLGSRVAPVTAPIPAQSLQHVLLLRYDALGDYIVTTALMRWIKNCAPQCRITVVSSYRNDIATRYDPNVDRQLAIDPQYTFHNSWMSALSLRREAPVDLVLAPIFTRLSKAAFISRLAAPKAPKATFLHPGRKHIYGKAFQLQVPMQPWREHIVDRLLALGRGSIDAGEQANFAARPYISFDVAHARNALEFAQSNGLRFSLANQNVEIHGINTGDRVHMRNSGKPYVVVNIASHMPDKAWKVETCIDLLQRLTNTWPDLVFLISGGPQRRHDAEQIRQAVNSPNCKTIEHDWLTFCAIVAGCEFLLGVDSAPVHVAAATGRPIALLVHKYLTACEWHPYGVDWRQVLSPSNEHVNDIPNDLVFRAVTELIEAGSLSTTAD